MMSRTESIKMEEGAKGLLEANVDGCRRLYVAQDYESCVRQLEECLSEAVAVKGKFYSAELHLLLAKCYRGMGDLKSAILSCNSALEHRSHWKDPYLVRSSCFQAWHTRLLETAGDRADNVDRDLKEADIVVDAAGEACGRKKVVRRVDEAFRLAKDGDGIFVKPGTYRVTCSDPEKAPFLLGKNVSLIGASCKDCVLLYGPDEVEEASASNLETLIICASSGDTPTLIKRLSFRCSATTAVAGVRTRFLGVAGGCVQLEDCLFDGSSAADVDAVYTSARICGSLAADYPPPSVVARFCVFASCRSFGTFTVARGAGAVRHSFFVGRSGVAALDCSKVKVENCEFARGRVGDDDRVGNQTVVSGSGSDVTVTGCYIHEESAAAAAGSPPSSSKSAVAVTVRSVASVNSNYIYGGGGSSGISCVDSEMVAKWNLVINCSGGASTTALGLQTGILVKNRSKVQVVSNCVQRCDVGIYLGDESCPVVRDNHVEASALAGILAERGSKPNVIGNFFIGGGAKAAAASLSSPVKGFGTLWLTEASGLIGKNHFERFDVSPVMIFTRCHPLVKDNVFENVLVDEQKQELLEKTMLNRFNAELFRKDHHFYMVDSQQTEADLRDIILQGQGGDPPKEEAGQSDM